MANIPAPAKKREGKGTPPPLAQTIENLEKTDPSELKPLNFKVDPDFHRNFKTFAAQKQMSMLELLQKGFELSKQHLGN